MQIVIGVIYHFVASLVGNVGVPNGPFVRDNPVECLGARWHCVDSQSRKKVAQVGKRVAYARAGNAAVDWEEVLCPPVHFFACAPRFLHVSGHETPVLVDLDRSRDLAAVYLVASTCTRCALSVE